MASCGPLWSVVVISHTEFRASVHAVFHWDRELVFTVILRSILSQTGSKLMNTSHELVILATTFIFVTNEINWRETMETK